LPPPDIPMKKKTIEIKQNVSLPVDEPVKKVEQQP
jgi:hypothetical protein